MGGKEGEGQGDCVMSPCAPVFPSGNSQAAFLEMASPLVSLLQAKCFQLSQQLLTQRF